MGSGGSSPKHMEECLLRPPVAVGGAFGFLVFAVLTLILRGGVVWAVVQSGRQAWQPAPYALSRFHSCCPGSSLVMTWVLLWGPGGGPGGWSWG